MDLDGMKKVKISRVVNVKERSYHIDMGDNLYEFFPKSLSSIDGDYLHTRNWIWAKKEYPQNLENVYKKNQLDKHTKGVKNNYPFLRQHGYSTNKDRNRVNGYRIAFYMYENYLW